uniref:AP2/ERF domain-containing protein n=1 Tax=Spumella elongata TaxID=89044 RepID=A0A7S3HQU0_9STRA|mmetsp:Transcript_6509/g.10925  ORF Transcript_6509/g.10925 Transcript_6509/m.10925 type:complete len:504 (+) Transcript_6509:32-1543(+)|eukprot:CAMPEP_0184979082 /NCGR_PEP_ID=MMETSP1098-20130426/9440_1 /TAXON_ID=89044 /ORGANISM="Spumella elongata, Strain CCAP 955/1" /LENGTH=503 /DNA_ID=CAMNT_0027502343 /DNA_START=32 /DNA_END=1543 /DNA_ORIENTATION=-
MENLVQRLELLEKSKLVDGNSGNKQPRSVYKGVYKCGNKFKAQIQISRVQHYLGLFDDELQAALAYDNHARIILGDKAKTNFDGNGSVFSPVPIVPTIEPSKQEKLKSEHRAVESKVRESTKSRKRLYIGINQRPSRFTPSGEMASGGMGADEMRDSAALLGQLKCRTDSSSDAEDPAAPSSSNYPVSHDYTAPSAYPAHKYPTYFHPGFAHPVSSISNSDVHDHYSSFFSLPVPGFGHMPPYSRFHEKYLPYSLPTPHTNSLPMSPSAPYLAHLASQGHSEARGAETNEESRIEGQDMSSSSKSNGSHRSYSAKTSTESMMSDDGQPIDAGSSSKSKSAAEQPTSAPVLPSRAPLDGQVTHWAGVLQYDAYRPGHIQVWRGTWVTSQGNASHSEIAFEKPSPAAFAQSQNHFDYVCNMRFALASDGQSPIPVSGIMRGIYSLGSSAHTGIDRELFVEFAPSGVPHRFNVSGCGEGDAGKFVVTGQFSAISCVLELTRQYISA